MRSWARGVGAKPYPETIARYSVAPVAATKKPGAFAPGPVCNGSLEPTPAAVSR